MFWRCLQLSLVALHFKILVNFYSIKIHQSPLHQWLPLPYNVHNISIAALKCFSNLTQKPFEIMLKLKTGSFFFLSIYLFPSGELFSLWKGSQNETAPIPFLRDCDLLQRPENTVNERTTEPQRQQCTDVYSSVCSLLNQNHRQRRMGGTAIGLKQNCITSHDDEWKRSKSVFWSKIPIFFF